MPNSKPIKKAEMPSDAKLAATMDYAGTAIFLLSDYRRFGLAERVCYHFDLIEALVEKEKSPSSSASDGNKVTVSGVAGVLECTPLGPWNRFLKRQKRALKNQLRAFNKECNHLRETRSTSCYQPQNLPLGLHPSSRLFFAYEATRIVFCVDASPSLTSTFGISGNAMDHCCPLDRLPEMARTYFKSLVENVSTPLIESGLWRPELAVTVMAVFPLGKEVETSLLVRDFRVKDVESAEILAAKINQWVHSEVEEGIAERMGRQHLASTWCVQNYSSSMRDILETADYALSVLSSEARPLIVVATDGRSVNCEGIVDVYLDIDRVDIPVSVLDLSMPEAHSIIVEEPGHIKRNELNFLTYDPANPSSFPLNLSDDSEALYGICRTTGGCYLNYTSLLEASRTVAGAQAGTEATHHYSFKRRFVKMNRIQWLTLFSLSPLSPTFHSSWGKIAPPQFLQRHLKLSTTDSPNISEGQVNQLELSRHESFLRQANDPRRKVSGSLSDITSSGPKKVNTNSRVTFSTYVVSPIRIKGLLLVRIKEGYRTKQYGSSTQDADKVFIQFTLPLQLGTVLHYELSFTALSGRDHTVGSAHIKIELSGNLDFIQSVKNDFLRQPSVQESRPFTMAQKVSSRLCKKLRWIRTEDLKCSYLSPPTQWSDQLGSPDHPFVRRLAALTPLQRRRLFQFHEFDIVFTGQMPYAIDRDFFSGFIEVDNGEQELFEHLSDWSTQTILPDSRYVKQMSALNGMTSYCVINIEKSKITPRLCSVTVEFYGGTDPNDRMETLHSLKGSIADLKDVEVLTKQLEPFLVFDSGGENVSTGLLNTSFSKRGRAKVEYHHAKWELIKDPELFPLLIKRRLEIGNFRLLDSNPERAILAKLVQDTSATSPGDLVQYQITVMADKVAIELHMESEGGVFSPFQSSSRFNAMAERLRSRDQQRGRALRSRTNLLQAFQLSEMKRKEELGFEDHRSSVERILAYSSRVSRKLRFFHQSLHSANTILCEMIETLLLSEPFGVRAAKLVIDNFEEINDESIGQWFVIQFDRDTMSLVHLSLVDEEEESDSGKQAFRNLTFFTSTANDLYNKRDDMVGDEDSADSHISEYLCVTEFADQFEDAMNYNFSAAYYDSLRKGDLLTQEDFQRADFDEVLRMCRFVEVTSVNVMEESITDHSSKLYQLMVKILKPVPGNEEYMFYCGDVLEEAIGIDGNGSVLSISSDESDNVFPTMDVSADEVDVEQDTSNLMPDTDDTEIMIPLYRPNPPIFIQFNLDGERASLKELQSLSKSSKLSVEMSIFRHGLMYLPLSHQTVANEIASLLKSYVAEQTIEALRGHGTLISEENLQLVPRYLKRIHSVISSTIDAQFYVSKTDQMVPLSTSTGDESAIEDGLVVLQTEFHNNSEFTFKPVSREGLVIFPAEGTEVAFWCFLYVRKGVGIVSQMYHPGGEDKASQVLSKVYSVVDFCLHRVNQQLLLRSMHQSRSASILLIPNQGQAIDIPDSPTRNNHFDQFQPGAFGCPIVFAKEFELYYRCALNPLQVSRTLEATVLDSLAILNRAGVFVYKDESESVFYMRLEAIGSGIDGDGKVELLVHGVNTPGPSITKQLTSLLERRVLLIAVDMLSNVLMKNPHFNWKFPDFKFLRSFEEDWSSLEESKATTVEAQDCFYEFPAEADDPCMVLLMFRQNICGSSFFHRLNDVGEGSLSLPITLSKRLEDGVIALNWNQHIFTLYYNNSPSKLDPSFQGLSTLTSKGAMLCREAGTGLAMIEVSLVNSNGMPLEEIYFGRSRRMNDSRAEVPIESQRFRKLDSWPTKRKAVCIRVHITGTTPNQESLHQLISLTLDQALIGWYAERLIEKFSLGLSPSTLDFPGNSDQHMILKQADPRMPGLKHLLDSSHNLPHPGIIKIEDHGIMRSSLVSTITLELLEKCILPLCLADPNTKEIMRKAASNLQIIRRSRSSKAETINLSWDPLYRKAVARKANEEETIKDSPIDCPEYICFFCLTEHVDQKFEASVRLYDEVMIHDNISDFSPSIELLTSVKSENPEFFYRSFAFVLSVKRNVRSLLTYNFNPQIVKSISARFHEINLTYVRESRHGVSLLQNRCLQALAPSSEVHEKNYKDARIRNEKELSSPTSLLSSEKPAEDRRPIRQSKIRRPVTIRRPKLIGKSVEGSAMQAVAASRRRASSNQFKKNIAVPKPVTKRLSQGSTQQTNSNIKTTESKSKRIIALEEDEDLAKVKGFYANARLNLSQRLSSVQNRALVELLSLWWPRKNVVSIPRSVADFLTRKVPLAWSDTYPSPPIPKAMNDAFILTFGRFITAFTPNLRILHLTYPQGDDTQFNSILLSSDIKNVHNCKCVVAVQISRIPSKGGPDFVNCRGMILNLPRRSSAKQRGKGVINTITTLSGEKDSVGMDKLASDLHRFLVLDSLLFDYSASLVERAVRLLEEKIDTKDLIPTVRGLISRHPLEYQRRMPRLNYRAFEATIVLKSYCDRFIDMFDGQTLFKGLYEQAEHFDMIRCNNGLCFKKGISVRGCHSVCFLTPHESDLTKMQLVILCRTQGRNLSDYMFREGSNVAIHIIDNIVLEASSLAFKELRRVAKKLQKVSLWNFFSSKRSMRKRSDVQENLAEMLALTNVRPMQQMIGNLLIGRLECLTLFESDMNIDWKDCCLAMQSDDFFTPNWSLTHDESISHLFYLEPDDIFLFIGIDGRGSLLKAGLVEKDMLVTLERRQRAIQRFSNFLLHFIWQSL